MLPVLRLCLSCGIKRVDKVNPAPCRLIAIAPGMQRKVEWKAGWKQKEK